MRTPQSLLHRPNSRASLYISVPSMRAICIQTDAQRPEAQTPNTLGLPGSWWQRQDEPCDGRARSGRLAPGWQDHEERIVLAFIQATKQRQRVPWEQLRQHLPGRSFDSVRQRDGHCCESRDSSSERKKAESSWMSFPARSVLNVADLGAQLSRQLKTRIL